MVIKIPFCIKTTKVLFSSKRMATNPAAKEPNISIVASTSPQSYQFQWTLCRVLSYRRDDWWFLYQASARQTLLQVLQTYHELTGLTSVITSSRRSVLDNHTYSILSILPDSWFHIPSQTPTFTFLIVSRLHEGHHATSPQEDTIPFIQRCFHFYSII